MILELQFTMFVFGSHQRLTCQNLLRWWGNCTRGQQQSSWTFSGGSSGPRRPIRTVTLKDIGEAFLGSNWKTTGLRFIIPETDSKFAPENRPKRPKRKRESIPTIHF